MNLSDRDLLMILKNDSIKNHQRISKSSQKQKIFCNLVSHTIFLYECSKCTKKCDRNKQLEKVLENFRND